MVTSEYIVLAFSALIFFAAGRFHLSKYHRSISPDGAWYLKAATAEKVPAPYCLRPLLGWIAHDNTDKWVIINTIATTTIGALTYNYLRMNGAGQLQAVTGVLLAAGLSGVVRTNTIFPVLTDAVGMCFTLAATAYIQNDNMAGAVVCLTYGALANEKTPIYAAILTGTFHPLFALAIPAVLYIITRDKRPSGVAYLDEPFTTAMAQHRSNLTQGARHAWDTYGWGVGVLWLAALQPDWQLLAAVAFTIVALSRSMDYSRIVHWAFPIFVLKVVTVVPAAILPALPVLHYALTSRDERC